MDPCPRCARPAPRAPQRRRRTPGRRPERGAAVVEFALVLPVFAALLLGILDFGSAMNDLNSVRQGVREGARQVVVADWATAGCTGSTNARVACLTKDRIGLDPARTRVRVVLPDDYETGDPVTVCAMYDLRSISGMFGPVLDDKVARSEITMRIEQLDDDAPLTAFSETVLTGQNWTWCT